MGDQVYDSVATFGGNSYAPRRKQDLHGTFLSSPASACRLGPGTLVDVWSASKNIWVPAVIGMPTAGNPAPSFGAVLCDIKDEQGFNHGTKWVRAEDALTMIRTRQTDLARPMYNNDPRLGLGTDYGRSFTAHGQLGVDARGMGPNQCGPADEHLPPWQSPQHQRGYPPPGQPVDYSAQGMLGPNHNFHGPPPGPSQAERGFSPSGGRSRSGGNVATMYPEDQREHSHHYDGLRTAPDSPSRQQALANDRRFEPHPDMTSILAPGAHVEIWRASDQVWHPATIATPDVLRGSTPPAPGAVLCIYEGSSRLQKWVRAEDSLSLIRPRRNAHTGPGYGDGPVDYVDPQTRVPLEYTHGYSVPQTRVPPGYG